MSLLIPKEYTELVNRLRKEGYAIELAEKNEWYFWEVAGNNIVGGFATTHDDLYQAISGQISLDHKDCFDKWSKCPIILPIPTNEKQLDFLIEQMKYFGSDEGYDVSNEYDWEEYITNYIELN